MHKKLAELQKMFELVAKVDNVFREAGMHGGELAADGKNVDGERRFHHGYPKFVFQGVCCGWTFILGEPSSAVKEEDEDDSSPPSLHIGLGFGGDPDEPNVSAWAINIFPDSIEIGGSDEGLLDPVMVRHFTQWKKEFILFCRESEIKARIPKNALDWVMDTGLKAPIAGAAFLGDFRLDYDERFVVRVTELICSFLKRLPQVQ